jgi:hypothetical protein
MFDLSRLKTNRIYSFFLFSCQDYLLRALTRSVVRLRYLSRSIINNKSRRFARHIRLVVF